MLELVSLLCDPKPNDHALCNGSDHGCGICAPDVKAAFFIR
jgi:hypothetical protein